MKVALVTGGSRGLGAAICQQLLEDGWAVESTSRSKTDFVIEATAAWPERFHWEQADLNLPGAAKATARAAVTRFGRIDALVNNMGVLRQELFLTIAPEMVESQVRTNLLSPIFAAQACARVMAQQGAGTILNVSSINAIRGHSGVAAYSAAKAGLDGLTRSLARELGSQGIRVNSIVPGFFESELSSGVTAQNRDRIARRTPLGRLGTIADAVSAACFLLSDRASFITGQTLTVDGGLTC
ncbi:SDR family NAD(P)-dependent oxidoreductase [Paenarthrobacter sp. NPDC089675]|uniref:SDR family NAD(P)-dependent oxidoreductase n=1 Tax=Paenarthrobacter sp. NPDC089675 TaxID=3364376 RepID=UPI0037FD4807